MYISITKQHLGSTFSQSSGDFVSYLEKENEDKALELQEHFFNQYNDRVSPEQVIKDIDGNTAKLRKRDPKFYSLTINPSQRELKHIRNDPERLRKYVRETMRNYADAFYRDTPVSVDSIKYYAKIEYKRHYKGYDKAIKENQPFKAKIVKLEHDLVKIRNGELDGNTKIVERQISKLKAQAPHQIDGKMIEQGMKKEGLQTHIHIVVSRKDSSNSLSLSPGSSHKASEAKLNGNPVKRGFDRDTFFENAEKTFDRLFKYDRNFVESYTARKMYHKNIRLYFAHLMKLPTNERSVAFKLLGKAGVKLPLLNIPTNQVQLAIKTIKQFRKVLDKARDAGSIGI
ncbi:MobB family relaxase [Tamlana sp. 2201CG12-4]|uniref:MobB family relaxase n=1 Tax=Tamlana sp. 2201CG12-4 TaxID=3112582 RepID=UPI002DB66BC7|nr:MobB family relaxase [Tamlana sp. 2201CG12-4]MEC3905971.1 MobB family relaxase [Tamlana sp. 2201CG12-4]